MPFKWSDDKKVTDFAANDSRKALGRRLAKGTGRTLLNKSDTSLVDLQRTAEGRGLLIRQFSSLEHLRVFASLHYRNRAIVRVFIPPSAADYQRMIEQVNIDGYTLLQEAPTIED